MISGEKKNIFFVFLLGLLFSAVFCSSAAARVAASVDELAVINSERDLLLYFFVKNSFTDEMKQGVENGIPVTFNFFVELYAVQQDREGKKIAVHSFDHTMVYDSLKEEFVVELEEHGGMSRSFQSLEEARGAMDTVHDFRVVELSQLAKGSAYAVKVRARLAKKTLPLNFQYIIPFWQLWKFETDWNAINFTYGNPGSATER
ncbi:MAG: DUF4390 domain-containing protein [Pseudomonadota bacterium]